LNKYDPTGGRRGGKVYLSLSDKAKKKASLEILGVDDKIQKRKTLYQLLIFFEIFKRTSLITQRQLEGFLRKIGSSLNSLEAIKTSHTSYPRITVFEPIKGVEIVRYIQSDFKLGDLKDTFYYIVIPGFTVKELVPYLNKLRKGKDPRPFSSHLTITNVPFVSCKNYTEDEIVDAIDSFSKYGLIGPINGVFSGEIRFDIADESLKSFIKDVWSLHDIDFRLLFERLAYNDKPADTDEKYLTDKKYLIFLVGKKKADQILAQVHNFRQANKEPKNSQKENKIAKHFIESLTNYRHSFAQDIIKTHEKVIKKYEIESELIEEVCFSPFNPI
jgi:hypothetical protein